MKEFHIEYYNGQSFDWLSWKAGTLLDVFGIENREYSVVKNRDMIRKYAVGWCESDNIPCRPKVSHMAVMFEYESNRFWTHLTMKEFKICFPEVENQRAG